MYYQQYPGYFVQLQIIALPSESKLSSTFGQHISFSNTGTWLAISDPSSSIVNVYTAWAGDAIPTASATATTSAIASATSSGTASATASSSSSASATVSASASNNPNNLCPEGYYGPNCAPCPGTVVYSAACDGHGICNGDSTRSGTGQCSCDDNWTGNDCSEAVSSNTESKETVITNEIVGGLLGTFFFLALLSVWVYYRRNNLIYYLERCYGDCFGHKQNSDSDRTKHPLLPKPSPVVPKPNSSQSEWYY